MWQIYAEMARDLARERQQEAEKRSAWRRAEESAATERLAHPDLAPMRAIAAPRRALAATLRQVGAGAGSLAGSACAAATRIEGRAGRTVEAGGAGGPAA